MELDLLNRKTKNIEDCITRIKEGEEIIRGDIKDLWKEENIFEHNFIHLKVPLDKGNTEYIQLHTYRYVTVENPKALVIFMHGYTIHNNNSNYLAKYFAQLDYVFVAFDVRGHGLSEGKRSCFESVEQILDDAKQFVNKVKEIYKDLPVFLGGLSMGGLMAYKLSLESPKDYLGVFLFAPAIKSAFSCWYQNLAACLGCLCPCINITSPTTDSGVWEMTSNPETANFFMNDKINKDAVMNLATLKALLKEMGNCGDTFKNYQASFICFMGGNDFLIQPESAIKLVQESPSADKHLYFYDRMYHAVVGEEEIFDILDKVKNYMHRKLRECESK